MAENPYSNVSSGSSIGERLIEAREAAWQEGYAVAKAEDADLLAACEDMASWFLFHNGSIPPKLEATISKARRENDRTPV